MRFTTRLLGYTILLTLLCFTTDILYGQFARALQLSYNPVYDQLLSDNQRAEIDEASDQLVAAIDALELDPTIVPSDFVGRFNTVSQQAFLNYVWQKINSLGFLKRTTVKAMMSLDYCVELFEDSPLSCADRALLGLMDDAMETLPQVKVGADGAFTMVLQEQPLDFYLGYDDADQLSLKLKGAGVVSALQPRTIGKEQFVELLTMSNEKIETALSTVSHPLHSLLGGPEAHAGVGLLLAVLFGALLLVLVVVRIQHSQYQGAQKRLIDKLILHYSSQSSEDHQDTVSRLQACKQLIATSSKSSYISLYELKMLFERITADVYSESLLTVEEKRIFDALLPYFKRLYTAPQPELDIFPSVVGS